MASAYLLTGKPGTGKTTLIREVVAGLKGRAGGFYTEEIREEGVRKGFRLVTLTGDTTTLAHVSFDSPYRVSKYGVDIAGLERVGVPALLRAAERCDLVVVDEIGKMEIFSGRFRETVERLLTGGKKLLGTVMVGPDQWVDSIKSRPQVEVLTLTRASYPETLAEVRGWVQSEAS